MNGLPRKGKLVYATFKIRDTNATIKIQDVKEELEIPEIVMTAGTFDYDLDNIEDTHQRLVELEEKVYRAVNDMKLPVLFDMWNTLSKDPTTQKILQLIRGREQV